jgi:hypothetical protein
MSIFIHCRGATCHATSLWNVTPYDVDFSDSQRWNWAYPQFLAGIISPPKAK